MKNTKMIKKLAALGGAACLSLSILACPIATLPVHAAPPNEDVASPMSPIIAYRYKVENGGLWRRLYNYTLNIWIGEWEYLGPYSG